MIYEAPAAEQMEILIEKDFLDGSLISGVKSQTSGVGGEAMDSGDLDW